MSEGIVSGLPVAVALLLAALPVAILALVLVAKRPLAVFYAFLGGWCAGLFLTGAVVITAADLFTMAGGTPLWASVLKLVVGVAMIVLAARKWRSRREAETPSWMAAVDTMTPREAFGLGFLVAAANPKNLVLVVAGATLIAESTIQVVEQAIALVVFVAVASLAVAAPGVARSLLGARSEPALAAADQWMTKHNATIMVVVLLILGIVLVVNALLALF